MTEDEFRNGVKPALEQAVAACDACQISAAFNAVRLGINKHGNKEEVVAHIAMTNLAEGLLINLSRIALALENVQMNTASLQNYRG